MSAFKNEYTCRCIFMYMCVYIYISISIFGSFRDRAGRDPTHHNQSTIMLSLTLRT